MRVKFISFNYTEPFSINPVYYWLKSFYKKTGKHYEKYTWIKPEHVAHRNNLENILKEKPDILCLSVFIWNLKSTMDLAEKIKAALPDIKIICGGPEVDAHTNPGWFDTYPFVDYVVYGDGEKAFADLLDYFYDPTIDFSTIPNVVTRTGKNKHQIFKFADYPAYSPYLDLKEEFLEDYRSLQLFHTGQKRSVYLPYELARGCMYKCSFCDWHGGIHHKVNRRIHNWKDDVDFFVDHDIRAFQTDANVGIYKDDVDFYKYVAEKSKPGRKIAVEPRNMAKLNKDRVVEIWDILSNIDSNPKFNIKAAVQTIYDDSLSKIERPDIPWAEHKQMLQDVKNKFPYHELTAEVIIGLPGVTIDRIEETFIEFADAKVDQVYSYDWMLLKKSPAGSQAYRDSVGLTTTKTYYPALANLAKNRNDYFTIKEFEKDPEDLIRNNRAYYIDMIYNTEAGVEGVIYHKLLTAGFNKIVRDPRFGKDLMKKYIDHKRKIFSDFAKKEAEDQHRFLEKNGFFFWGWMDHDRGIIMAYEQLFKKII